MTLLWFIIWFIADHVGPRASIVFDPPNAWTVTLLLAIAIDINRPPFAAGRRK